MLDFNGALTQELYRGIAQEREREMERRRWARGRKPEKVERREMQSRVLPRRRGPRPLPAAWLF